MRKSPWNNLIITCISILLLISACSKQPSIPSQSPTPTMIQPSEGKGGMRGIVDNFDTFFINSKVVYVFAAEFQGDEQGEGVFLLEPSIHPHTRIEDGGVFQLNDMPPGKYVLVVGPSPEESVVYKLEGKTRVFEVPNGEVTDIGLITLAW